VRKQWTPLGKWLVGDGTAAAAGALAAGAIGAGILTAKIVSGLTAAAVFVADPALVLGDVCLFGWEE
jgi:hypothetical protein